MFFRNYSTYEGEPARLYRSPNEIRKDIFEIKTKIESMDSKLNIRNVLTAMIDVSLDQDPEKWIIALSEIVDDAEQTLDTLKRLRETLDLLSEELEDTKWALGI